MPWSPSRRPLESFSSPNLLDRRKRSRTGCRLLLVVLLWCLFWIYGTGQQGRDFDSGGTTPDRTEGTLTISMGNGAPTRNPHPTVPDGDFDPSPPRTIAVVLPVTSSSLSHLSESLSGLSAARVPYLSEIHLLCPENITTAVRGALRQILSRSQGFGHTEFFVALWRDGRSEAEATLRIASSILATGTLILPQDALASIDPISRSIIFSWSPSLPVPIGLRGSEVSCETKYRGFLSAGFVFPPLLLPSRLGTANQSYFHLPSWQELGAHFARAEGVGGVVPLGTWENTSSCQHLDASEMAPLRPEHSNSLPDFPESRDLLVILVAEREDILAWSKIACEFKSRGEEVKVITYTVPPDPPGPFDSASEGCGIAYTQAHDLQDLTVSQLLGRSPGVLLTLTDHRFPPGSLLEENTGTTVIRIPRRDLPHCDWIASLRVRELRNWHAPRVDLSIVTNDRPSSLRRLLQSLSDSRYYGDKLDIRISIEQDADYETLELVDQWDWEHGSVSVTRRIIHAGLLPAIVESWYPHSNNSYGLILEDDVEVSPLFYAWLKVNLLRYRYGENQNRSAQMFGISLYQPKVIETRPEGRAFFNPRTVFAANDITEYTTPYLSQIPCSWGAVYFPEHWREFHSYLGVRLSEVISGIDAVVVPDARSNRWPKSWKKYFIELAYLRGYVMVYPNYNNFVSLSTNHLEIGSHVKDGPRESYEQKREMFRVPVMGLGGTTRLVDLPHGTLPPFDDLPVLDLFGQLSSLEALIRLGQERRSELIPTCERSSENRIRPDFRGLLCVSRTE